jgi:two-component system LytT family response regulator
VSIKLKCILLDDELPGLQYLRLICGQVPGLEIVKAFNDPAKCLAEQGSLDYDFCILDIHMPGMSGLEVAHLLRPKPVIFTTGYKEYAADAFDLDAVDYIRKPVARDRFEKAIQKMAERLASQQPQEQGALPHPASAAPSPPVPQSAPVAFVRLNTHKGKMLVYFDQVLLITASQIDARDKTALLENGQEVVLKNISFGELLSLLPGDRFCRVNKSCVVAIKAVDFFSYDEITTMIPARDARDGQVVKLTLSEAYRADFAAKTAK